MNTLRPVEVSEYYIQRIAKGMQKYFWDNIFKQIFDILKDRTVNNAGEDDLINAIRSGKVWYENGAFRTKTRFPNSIATVLEKMGAKFVRGAYVIEQTKIPMVYINAINYAKAHLGYVGSRISDFLLGLDSLLAKVTLDQYISASVDSAFKKLQLDIIKSAQEKKIPVIELGIVQPNIKVPKQKTKEIEAYWKEYDKKAEKLNKEILKAKKDGEESETLKAQLKELRKDAYTQAPSYDVKIDDIELNEQSKKITEDYVYNLKYWVKKWEAKNIIKMRQDVADMVQKGERVLAIQEYFEKRWKVAKDKANFLAVNESHLAGSVIKATSYQELGCNSFVWGRSSSKEKRKLHEEYYGETFTFDNPPIIDEKLGITGLPRQIWNCLPAKEPIVSPFFYKRIYRRWYKGKLTTLVTNTGYSLNTTPNHPILTDKGWVGAGSIKIGDKIAKVKDDFIFSTSKNPQNPVTTIDQLFDFFSVFLNPKRVTTTTGDFHGDGMIDEQVEIINIESNLFFNDKTVLDKEIIDFFFSKAEDALIGIDFSECGGFFKSLSMGGFIPEGIISVFDKMLTLIDREFTHSYKTSFSTISCINTLFLQMVGYSASCSFEMLCKSLNTPAIEKHTLYRFIWELFILVANTFMTDDVMPVFTHTGAKITSIDAELLGDFTQIQSFNIEFDTVVDKFSSEFNSHIFNLENVNNWYLYHNYIIKNCKCHMLIKPPTLAEIMDKAEEVRNAKRNIFKRIFNSKQCNNTAWRYRRFGEG